ncbi:ABC transporter ATP-binding protein [Kiritimatiellaeota bacterium B1221]|nr:ABC transporter ATP-binding protein [Kiritimatiellaeota bacterium B1221]
MKIQINQVSKVYKRTPALDGVSCDISPGTVGAVIGLNGAGKTTLLRLLAGLLVPNKGEVLYDGSPFDRRDMDLRRRMFFLSDELPALPDHSPLRHAAMVLPLYGASVDKWKAPLMDLYERFDLLSCLESPMGKLSRGQLYKAVLAPLMLISPELWLVDEPFAAGMDPEGMQVFREQARQAADAGCTVLFSTQILEIAEEFADVIYVLHQGQLVNVLPVAEWKIEREGGSVNGEVLKILGRLRREGVPK